METLSAPNEMTYVPNKMTIKFYVLRSIVKLRIIWDWNSRGTVAIEKWEWNRDSDIIYKDKIQLKAQLEFCHGSVFSFGWWSRSN